MSRKGQIFSSDFLIASSIFLIAIAVIYIYWGYASAEIEESRITNDMIDKLYLASHVWFREGTPRYWDSSNVIELGLQSDHEFNQTKMSSLTTIEYQRTLTLLGVENYNIYYRVYDESNNTLFEFGLFPYEAENVLRLKRVGILNQSIAMVDVILWL